MKISKPLRVVIDTNVFLVIVAPTSKYHWLFEKIEKGEIEVIVSNAMLNEYEEKLAERYQGVDVEQFLKDFLIAPRVFLLSPWINWQLIEQDPDDNAFVDCAIAADADFIITHDKHFNILKEIAFPQVQTLKIQELEELLKIRE